MSYSTIKSALDQACQLFTDAGIDTPRLDAEILLEETLHKKKFYFLSHLETALTEKEQKSFKEWVERRLNHIPIAYIIGEWEFYSLPIKVNPEVLIPRPDTEILVDEFLKIAPKNTSVTIADIGTGSGAIACAIANELPQATIFALDISDGALKTASENVQNLNLAYQVKILKSNFLDNAPSDLDFIVSNPPYIPSKDISDLMPEVHHEPKLALDGGIDGLDPYRIIIRQSLSKLKKGGYLLFEHGFNQASEVSALLAENKFTNISVFKDLGNRDRVTIGQKAF